MKPLPLNMKSFKKIKEDKDTATFKHKDGHHFVIAKKALSKSFQKQLADIPCMADGGEVIETQPETPVDLEHLAYQQEFANAQASPSIDPNLMWGSRGMGAAPEAPPSGTPVPLPEDDVGKAYASAYNASLTPPAEVAPMPGAAPAAMATTAAQEAPPAPTPGAKGAEKPPGDLFGNEAYSKEYTKGLSEIKAGLQKEYEAAKAQGTAQAKLLEQANDRMSAAHKNYNDNYATLDAERKALASDIQGRHIDPMRYLNSMSTGNKVMTAIGMILGGIGAGQNGTNPAMEFLQKQIDRDIDTQKADLGAKENLLSANLRQFGNMKDATDMTRVMQMDILSNQMKQEAAKVADPMAKARLLQEAGKLDMQAAPVMSQIAMRRTVLAHGREGAIAPEMIVQAYAQTPAERENYMKEVKEMKESIAFRDNALSAFDKIASLQTAGNRIGSPVQSAAQIDALKQPLLAALSKATAGRFTEQDAHMLDAFFPQLKHNEKTVKMNRLQFDKALSEKMHFPLLAPLGISPQNYSRYQLGGGSVIQHKPANLR